MAPFRTGIDTLLQRHADWLKGRRVGLVMHPASVDAQGCPSAERLLACPGITLAALYGPEHGCLGMAAAGETVRTRRHPVYGLPMYSLYGRNRRPTGSMLRDVDCLVFDLQDLALRPYTYGTTLRYVLEAAREHGLRLIVADRPGIPADLVDGPLLDPAFESFLAGIPAPLVYGMTAGETASWLNQVLGLGVDLRIARMRGYARRCAPGGTNAPWIPPSPAIRSRNTPLCYAATVVLEALPQLDHGRANNLAFQVFGGAGLSSEAVLERLTAYRAPGVRFYRHVYPAAPGGPRMIDGIRMVVTDAHRYRPALTGVTILAAIQHVLGKDRLWKDHRGRPEFLDKLYGTDRVRLALQDDMAPTAIAAEWQAGLRRFRAQRSRHLLYGARSKQGTRRS